MTMEEYAAKLTDVINDSIDKALISLQSLENEDKKYSINQTVLLKSGDLRRSMETYNDGETISVDWMIDYAGAAYYHSAAEKTTEDTYDHWLDKHVNPHIEEILTAFSDKIFEGIIDGMR